jgi:hypothetical protein
MPQFSFGTSWIHTRTFSFGAPTASTSACVTFSITACFCSGVRPSIM